jgi:hypothetical protein
MLAGTALRYYPQPNKRLGFLFLVEKEGQSMKAVAALVLIVVFVVMAVWYKYVA